MYHIVMYVHWSSPVTDPNDRRSFKCFMWADAVGVAEYECRREWYRVPVYGARRRRVRILIGVVVGARDYRGRDALHVRAKRREIPGRIAIV